jgi:hypothetical protein
MSNKTISVQDLRTLLENAWAAGYVCKSAGIEACESEYVRQKYVEEHIKPYMPKVEEVRKPEPEFDMYAYLGLTKKDVHDALDDFFFSGLRDTCVKSGRAVPDWMHL